MDWEKEETLKYNNPGKFSLFLPDRTINIETDKQKLSRLMIWWQPGKDFVCFEPWWADTGALNNPYGCFWIQPGEVVEYQIKYNVEFKNITDQNKHV